MSLLGRLKKYHFEIRHLLVLFLILILFQVVLYYVHSTSINSMLNKTMDLYRLDAAERLANLTTTSLELVLEMSLADEQRTPEDVQQVIQAFDIILTQQKLQQNVDDMCMLFTLAGNTYAVDNGEDLYNFIFHSRIPTRQLSVMHTAAISNYSSVSTRLSENEEIYSMVKDGRTFQVFVPFVPKGEMIGAMYMEISPDFSKIAEAITVMYDETGIIFSVLILFGLLAMFFITMNTVRERDEAQQALFQQREAQLKQEIEHEKEAMFTKRIYHAHHKAEKIMGFIKEEIRALEPEKPMDEFKQRLMKYSNFVSRVIYDMKTYEPPVHVIRNPAFQTDLNGVIRFIVRHIFQRHSHENSLYSFALDLDDNFPIVHINEYVIWEIIEPLIQNSLDHNTEHPVTVRISTEYREADRTGFVHIRDDGKGIGSDLLQTNEDGVRKIFLEHTSTKDRTHNSGYGCYIAYEISIRRCGWNMDVHNLESEGCEFVITIPDI
ncbi:MAG: ATP-binding protein [Candidatus Marinimicrobia bacterium]|nr:ATP-binding protein [Candidatus Neomarinimicrobiota bacterium]MCF7829568.1 ATP-binding protein [Candidatus Neomarinimicrobiota bacterium]MCF7882018.1 ATP-binding protein [Candidatus Neomarinimicrobiota bacterium]